MDIFVAAGQMLVLFAMMFTGYFLARRDWINDSLSSALSRLVVNIFNPFLMISSVFGQSLKQSGPLFWENLVLVGIFTCFFSSPDFLSYLSSGQRVKRPQSTNC